MRFQNLGIYVENSVFGVSNLSGTSVCGLLSVGFVELINQLIGIVFWVDIDHLEDSLDCCRPCEWLRYN